MVAHKELDMAKCAPQRFPKFTSECLHALRSKVRSAGVSPDEAAGGMTSGNASRAGFEIAWTYDLASQMLTVQCVHAPFYVPCTLITAQIERWIFGCYPASRSEIS